MSDESPEPTPAPLIIDDVILDAAEHWYGPTPEAIAAGRWPKSFAKEFDLDRGTRKRLTSSLEIVQRFAKQALDSGTAFTLVYVPHPESGRFTALLAMGFATLGDDDTPESVLAEDAEFDETWNGRTNAGDAYVAGVERNCDFGTVRGDATSYVVAPVGTRMVATLIFMTVDWPDSPSASAGPRAYEDFVQHLSFPLAPEESDAVEQG